MAPMEHNRILLIDSYDSFTYNLASLCRQAIPSCIVHIIKNDAIPFSRLANFLQHFDAIIIGPGPGSPDNDDDVGVVKDIWKLADENLLPVFGVCLGLQSLGIAYGATLARLNVVKHGQISHIYHTANDLYHDVSSVDAVRYHSLHVTLHHDSPLQPLAWADDGHENGRVVMALKHTSKPFWAVQYHPESVRTHGGGEEVIRNFWRLGASWRRNRSRITRLWTEDAQFCFGNPWPHMHAMNSAPSFKDPAYQRVSTRVVESSSLNVITICEALGVEDDATNFVLLDSAAQPGRFSIVGCLLPTSPHVTYRVGDTGVCITTGGGKHREPMRTDFWTWASDYMRSKNLKGGDEGIPFWGGFVGFLSYELGASSLSPGLASKPGLGAQHHDANLVFVERSLVVDSFTGKIVVQSILPDDEAWILGMVSHLDTISAIQPTTDEPCVGNASNQTKLDFTAQPGVTIPDKMEYIRRIKKAQEYLLSGDSYELCLTAPTRASIPVETPTEDRGSSSWHLYKSLRRRNPAPHSAYLRLHPSTLLASSPERFLSYSRPPNPVCQLRPIKGTIRKRPDVDRSVAEKALVGSVKEVAENLMIVDLIRHDLHHVVGDDVVVKQFCGVEEYETVWQMVSVIEGRLPEGAELDGETDLGWEVLRQSLPPGSMTGAPKKRSVEILQALEDEDRSIYSGVFGYWCGGGGGDWSVTIRSCFKYDGDLHQEHTEWTMGAGGAITALSDPEAEWDEMIAKVESVLPALFQQP